jgi:hypothetical protein
MASGPCSRPHLKAAIQPLVYIVAIISVVAWIAFSVSFRRGSVVVSHAFSIAGISSPPRCQPRVLGAGLPAQIAQSHEVQASRRLSASYALLLG